MELADKIKLIDDLIREDPEHTIRDYLEYLNEIEGIERREEIRRAIQNLGMQKYRA